MKNLYRRLPNSGLNRKSIQTSIWTIASATRTAVTWLGSQSLYSLALGTSPRQCGFKHLPRDASSCRPLSRVGGAYCRGSTFLIQLRCASIGCCTNFTQWFIYFQSSQVSSPRTTTSRSPAFWRDFPSRSPSTASISFTSLPQSHPISLFLIEQNTSFSPIEASTTTSSLSNMPIDTHIRMSTRDHLLYISHPHTSTPPLPLLLTNTIVLPTPTTLLSTQQTLPLTSLPLL